ncbi:MAG: ATP-binding cassette domain-containing protein [Actinobacteria bacterium]|uniref:Unannotated protein n=1 Tax=freshwater metagenome TaxID=449393 RepID=A0A6J6XLR6_9ZZZZ|nr:ATP-binding cassette domain-containing protein [Actinomycetota bacterium]MSW05889.1 ATP-binding cassette domain-containing protein [Actinomycetota bacterium]MSX82083.1 ATP-binding cassette domain-containing protein [Actinomycetota bacterium]
MTLSLRNLSVSYGDVAAISGVDLEIKQGTTLAVLGASGSGKSTLLRAVAGLEPSHGEILWGDEPLHRLPTHLRGVGFVFQDHALFPQRNVLENVRFGLETPRYNRRDAAERASALLDRVGLAGFEERHTHELSGGERQRVALARALAPAPRVLLLDEPYGALDRELRERLMLDVREILRDSGVTVIHVTHDHDEAFALGENVAILDAGKISQCAPPSEVWANPCDLRTARFLGHTSRLRADLRAGTLRAGTSSLLDLSTALGEFAIPHENAPTHGSFDTEYWVTWRPESLRAESLRGETQKGEISRQSGGSLLTVLGTVIECSFRHGNYLLSLETAAGRVEGISSESVPRGQHLTLNLNLDEVRAYAV